MDDEQIKLTHEQAVSILRAVGDNMVGYVYLHDGVRNPPQRGLNPPQRGLVVLDGVFRLGDLELIVDVIKRLEPLPDGNG